MSLFEIDKITMKNKRKPDKPVYKNIRPSVNKSVINAYIAITNIKLQDRPNT